MYIAMSPTDEIITGRMLTNARDEKEASSNFSELVNVLARLQPQALKRMTFVGHANKETYGDHRLPPEQFVEQLCDALGDRIKEVKTIDLIDFKNITSPHNISATRLPTT